MRARGEKDALSRPKSLWPDGCVLRGASGDAHPLFIGQARLPALTPFLLAGGLLRTAATHCARQDEGFGVSVRWVRAARDVSAPAPSVGRVLA